MDSDPGIVCFTHCGPRVFCFELPEHCPACRVLLATQSFILPFRVPFPFVRASQHPCSVVIKPTHGDFLNDFKASQDLHIGVTTTAGRVIEYDKGGVHKDRTKEWNECLVVYQVNEEHWKDQWDHVLLQIADHDSWSTQRYNEETFNCYTFVLAFIRCLRMGDVSDAAASKTKFCEQFVAPRAAIAWKYITLYRHLKDRGYYVCRAQTKHRKF